MQEVVTVEGLEVISYLGNGGSDYRIVLVLRQSNLGRRNQAESTYQGHQKH